LRVLAKKDHATARGSSARRRKQQMRRLSRRSLLAWLGAGAGLALGGPARAQTAPPAATPLPTFTGPGVNPFVRYPQKLPLLRMTDRGIQLETPRPYFLTPFTPNAAFYVRYHLELIPNAIAT
jgi:hypothetical protein